MNQKNEVNQNTRFEVKEAENITGESTEKHKDKTQFEEEEKIPHKDLPQEDNFKVTNIDKPQGIERPQDAEDQKEEDKETESRPIEEAQTSENQSELPFAQTSLNQGKDEVQMMSKSGPKKPMSPFFQFSKSRREQLKKQNPGLSMRDVNVLLAQEWRALTPEAKAPFKDLAAKDKERYEREKKELAQTETSESKLQ